MSEEKKEKRCCGCKTPKPLDNFYKHKKQSDGHSPYCIECTRENSKRYFQRKKERTLKSENDNLMKMVLLNNYNSEFDRSNADNFMKILMIEKMCKSILDELDNLKQTYIKSESQLTQ